MAKKEAVRLTLASGDAAPLFEPQEGISDKMTQFIGASVIVAGLPAVAARRNDALHTIYLRNGIGIVAFVGGRHSAGRSLSNASACV